MIKKKQRQGWRTLMLFACLEEIIIKLNLGLMLALLIAQEA